MNTKNKYLSSVFFLMLLSFLTIAQNDTLKKNNDSLNSVILNEYNQKLILIENQRIADSTKRAELENQLNSLKTTDNLDKEKLQQQLEELNNQDNIRIEQKRQQIESLRTTAKNYPVIGFFNDTLFSIYSKLGSFSAKDRAEAIGKRINSLADSFNFNGDSLIIIESESTVDIMFGETIIMSVSENDAIWENETKIELANKYRTIIVNEVMHFKSETSLSKLLKEIGLAILVLFIIVVIIIYINKSSKWLANKISEQENKKINGFKIRNYTLFDAKREVGVLLNINTLLKWLIILLVIYIALPILFGIFPWTKGFATTLFSYILNPLKKIAGSVWHFLPDLFTILVIIFVFRYIFRALAFLKSEIENESLTIPGFYADWANPTYQIIRVLVFAFMVIVIFPYLPGSDSPIFQGVSVFLGFLFTFGSSGSLSNVIAGLVLTYMRLFKIGDRVKIGEVVGDVIEKSLLVTRIRTIKNEIISIPNSTVMNSHTVNYSSDAPEKGLIIHTTVTIGYDVPWRDMHQILIDAALKTDLIMKEPLPFVLQTSLDDFYVSYQINAFVREAKKQATIYSNLHQNIQDTCNEKGVEILSPHYRAARDGNSVTIPLDYLPKDYTAPAFNVNIKKEK